MFAKLVNDGLIARETLEKCLFGLVRLDAFSAQHAQASKTVCVTLPGQGVSAVLMPVLQAVFPCERHVFIYDGCRNVVSRSLVNRKVGDPEKAAGRYQCVSTVMHTTPMTQHLPKQIRSLPDPLSQLPGNLADTVESWMTSVDSFLKLKDDEANNEYLPFVSKLSLLLDGPDQEMALQNLLQFMTGARSRPLPEGAVSKAQKAVASLEVKAPPKFAPSLHKAIEDCAFRHKGILIGDKTFIDTVLPQKEWSLKAAKKISGCACCGPEDEDEDEYNPSTEGSMTMMNGVDLSKPGAFTQAFDVKKTSNGEESSRKRDRPAYVDGKTAFAFDPTKFA